MNKTVAWLSTKAKSRIRNPQLLHRGKKRQTGGDGDRGESWVTEDREDAMLTTFICLIHMCGQD